MAQTSYSYALSDTANNAVNVGSLQQEIQGSSIVIAVQHIDQTGNDIDIHMKEALSTSDQTYLSAVVAAHEGLPEVTTIQAVMPIAVTLEPTGDLAKVLQIQGKTFTAEKNATTEYNLSWAYDVELQGVDFWTDGNHSYGDSIDVTLQHPDPAVGELGRFGDNVWIHPDGKVSVKAEGTQTIPAGLILRVYYTCTGTGNNVGCYLNLRLWL